MQARDPTALQAGALAPHADSTRCENTRSWNQRHKQRGRVLRTPAAKRRLLALEPRGRQICRFSNLWTETKNWT